ncbi:aftiphilin-like [Hyalella azteca]|uniref:Aftiphilin-like n=1 Tax=Hyalella azteca TaxID=294128 RepID=A0A8B7PI31_HYAAZ|nr:aftiphilin-like [Hyalella azteca]
MSFDSYPLPLSSSPPPLDILPSPTEEDEEEFGQRVGIGSPVFDITGLSEKLPPTPQVSPAKHKQSRIDYALREDNSSHFPGTKNLRNNFSSVGEHVDSPPECLGFNHPGSFNNISVNSLGPIRSHEKDPCPTAEFVHENFTPKITNASSCSEKICHDFEDDEFGDFAGVDMESDQLSKLSASVENKHPSREEIHETCRKADEKNPDSLDFRDISSLKSNLDPVNTMSVATSTPASGTVVIRSNVPCIVEHVEQSVDSCHSQVSARTFFPSVISDMSTSSPIVSIVNSEIVSGDSKAKTETSELVTDEHGHLVPWKPYVMNTEEDVFHYFQAPTETSEGSDYNLEPHKLESESDLKPSELQIQESQDKKQFSRRIHAEEISSEGSIDIELDEKKTTENNSEIKSFDANKSIVTPISLNSPIKVADDPGAEEEFEPFADFNSFPRVDETFHASVDGSIVSIPAVVADDVVMSCSLPTIEGMSENSPDDDFGYRDIDAEEDDLKSEAHKDLPAVEAKNDRIIFQETKGEESSIENSRNVDEDEFADFVASTEVNDDQNREEFEEFASAKIDDAFGEYGSESAILNPNPTMLADSDNDDDGFGEFTEFSEAGGMNSGHFDFAVVREASQSFSRSTSLESRPEVDSIKDPLLAKLDGLVRKWITPAAEDLATPGPPPELLRDVVKGDAFVWRKLESVEWRGVVWQSSVANGLLLSALNMDARNILYNQKWSSSVPLFAQSLGFSPLTPAKSSSMSGLSPHSSAPLTHNSNGSGNWQPKPMLPASGDSWQLPQPKGDNDSCPSESKALRDEILPQPMDVSSLDILHASSKQNTVSPSSQLDWLSYDGNEHITSLNSKCVDNRSGSSGGSESTLPAAVQRLLATSVATTVTTLEELTPRERQFVQALPDLSFMTARVLMFPIARDKE